MSFAEQEKTLRIANRAQHHINFYFYGGGSLLFFQLGWESNNIVFLMNVGVFLFFHLQNLAFSAL